MKTKYRLGAVKDMSNMKFHRKRRGSIYDPIFEKMKALKIGQGFTVDVPAGEDPAMMRNRIGAAFGRIRIQPPRGGKFRKQVQDGKVYICCVKA